MNDIDKVFNEWLEKRELGTDYDKIMTEAHQTSRYSIEVNYRTNIEEVMNECARLQISYISAGMKAVGYHTKLMLTDKPFRVMISTRNWDDGEWVGICCFNHSDSCYVLAQGHYNKDRKTVSIQKSSKCMEKSAAEVVKKMRNLMEQLKKESPRDSNSLKPVNLKRGPKAKKFLGKL